MSSLYGYFLLPGGPIRTGSLVDAPPFFSSFIYFFFPGNPRPQAIVMAPMKLRTTWRLSIHYQRGPSPLRRSLPPDIPSSAPLIQTVIKYVSYPVEDETFQILIISRVIPVIETSNWYDLMLLVFFSSLLFFSFIRLHLPAAPLLLHCQFQNVPYPDCDRTWTSHSSSSQTKCRQK